MPLQTSLKVGRTDIVRIARFAAQHGWEVRVVVQPYRGPSMVANKVETLHGVRGHEAFDYTDRLYGELETYRTYGPYPRWRKDSRDGLIGFIMSNALFDISTSGVFEFPVSEQ